MPFFSLDWCAKKRWNSADFLFSFFLRSAVAKVNCLRAPSQRVGIRELPVLNYHKVWLTVGIFTSIVSVIVLKRVTHQCLQGTDACCGMKPQPYCPTDHTFYSCNAFLQPAGHLVNVWIASWTEKLEAAHVCSLKNQVHAVKQKQQTKINK